MDRRPSGLLHDRSAQDLEEIYRRSLELGAGRAAQQALLLADALFGTLESNLRLRAELQADGPARRLCRLGLAFLSEAGEPTERRLGTIPIHWTHFKLLGGTRAKLAELSRKLHWSIFRLTN